MAESASHIYLVEQLSNIISTKFNIDSLLSYIDLPNSKYKPQKINDYIPDYYYCSDKSRVIIGEAKTINDVICKHTIEQVTAFLKKCSEYNISVFVFAVPWQLVNYSKGMIRKICRDNALNVKYIVLENLRDVKND